MREQAKKMNVASLRSSEAAQTSAECKLAKIALMTISLWFMAWTPYLVTNFVGIFGNSKITPLATIWCSLFAKANAVYNPIVYGIRWVVKQNSSYTRIVAFLFTINSHSSWFFPHNDNHGFITHVIKFLSIFITNIAIHRYDFNYTDISK